MSSPYQQNATIAEENTPIAKSTAQNKRPKNKIPRIEAKDLDELSKSWYPVQGPTRVIINDKKPLFNDSADKAQRAAGMKPKSDDISEDWEVVEHDDADEYAEAVSASGKVTRSVTTGIQ